MRPTVEVPRSFLSTIKGGFFSSAQTGLKTAFLAGVRGVTTGAMDAITVMIDSNGQLGTVSSSRRYKEEIRDMAGVETSARPRQLRPVTFRYRQASAGGEKPVQFGLIAEEVAEVFPELGRLYSGGLGKCFRGNGLDLVLTQPLKATLINRKAINGFSGDFYLFHL